MDDSLQGKAALVTGAARRVGSAIARRLHAAGASVAIHHRGGAAEAAALEAEFNAKRSGSAMRVQADLLEEDAPQRMVEAVRARWGRLDLLVNNASAFHPTAIGEVGRAQWESIVGSNLRAPMFLAQAAAPLLAEVQGAIVSIVDIHAERPLKDYPVYSVAKAGLAALTRALAIELAPRVRVNAVAPGAILWPEDGQFDPGERERVVATTPLARLGRPEDIAQAVHFLAVAPYVTGQVLAVDGGRSVFL